VNEAEALTDVDHVGVQVALDLDVVKRFGLVVNHG